MTSILIGHHLIPARFLERKNRFLCRVEVEGTPVDVHLHDPGRLKELLVPGARVLLREEGSPNRKTGHDMVGIYHGDVLVSCDSRVPNRLIGKALEEHTLLGLPDYSTIIPEYTYGTSRLDFCLDSTILLEVKGVSLVTDGHALFPDAPTQRGKKHVETLIQAQRAGFQCYMVFLVQRPDAHSFSPHKKTDPQFTAALLKAVQEDVTVLVYTAQFQGEYMYLRDSLSTIHLPDSD
jgi:sugar fermentation stimulation protein A